MKVLAVSSGGGHWVELLRLVPAFEQHSLHFVTVNETYERDVRGHPFSVVQDATRWNRVGLLVVAWQLLRVMRRFKPDIVLSTGAAPGLLSLVLGKLFRARTIWVDSIANVDELSGSGRMAGRWADLWLTQWEHLADPAGPEYAGKVL